MKSQLVSLILALAVAVAVAVVVVAASDDGDCRQYAAKVGVDVSKVGPMVKFGPPEVNQTCTSLCHSYLMDFALEYPDENLCCCGTNTSA